MARLRPTLRRTCPAESWAASALLAEHHPSLVSRIDQATGLVTYEGPLTYEAGCGIPAVVQIRLEGPDEYPRTEPRAYDGAGRYIHDEDGHFYTDSGGRCCLWLSHETGWNPNDSGTLKHFVGVCLREQHATDCSKNAGDGAGEAP